MAKTTDISSLEDYWKKTIEFIKSRVHLTTYNTIFSELSPLSIESNELVLACPNNLIKDWIEKKYNDILIKGVQHNFPDIENTHIIVTEKEDKSGQTTLFKSEDNDSKRDYPFNPKHNFDSFVVADSNEFPYNAARAISEEPGKLYNPLFIYGGVGLGKTHLLHAIANYVYRNHRNLLARYVTSERFTNDFIQSVRDKSITYFHKKYRETDTLLVDDIQFLQGKEQTQEEFFHTFNTLYESGKQIVISSDRPPKNLSNLEDRLVSRFKHGLIVDIHPPDLETRVAILMKKAEYHAVFLPEDVTTAIAERITSNIRELEGALNRVIAFSKISKRPLSASLAKEVLEDIFPETAKKPININQIQNAVCSYFNVSKSDIVGNKRNASLVYARHIAMYLSRELTDESLPRIGESFGGRDHSTVLYAFDKVSNLMKEERQTLSHINNLSRTIKERV